MLRAGPPTSTPPKGPLCPPLCGAGPRGGSLLSGPKQGAKPGPLAMGQVRVLMGTFWGAWGHFGVPNTNLGSMPMGSGLQEGQVMVRMAEPPSFPPHHLSAWAPLWGGTAPHWGSGGVSPDPLLVPPGTLPRVGQSTGGHGGLSHQREVLGCPGVPRRGCEPLGGRGGAVARRCPQVSAGGRGLSAVPPSIPQLSRSRRGR